ncbi:MAG: hypothetical protein N2745_03270 [Syntrophorhabdaceae bacterium]|nr:hypothetical protein [Syntrophorhabdaceae bacterium]
MTNLEKRQIDLIKETICVYEKCLECKRLFQNNSLCFANVREFVDDKGESCLFRLKEMCHSLYKDTDATDYKEKLFAITVGYIFHEAMILRENLYQLEFYKPHYERVTGELTGVEKKIVNEIWALTKRAEKRLGVGMEEVKRLVKELVVQLKDLIKMYKENYLLPRFIFDNRKSFIRIYGKKGFEKLLNEMYSDGEVGLTLRAAKSYLESEYYDIAKKILRGITHKTKGNSEAVFLYMYASAFHHFLKNRFSKAIMYAMRACEVSTDDKELEKVKEALKTLIKEIKKELRNKKGKKEVLVDANL